MSPDKESQPVTNQHGQYGSSGQIPEIVRHHFFLVVASFTHTSEFEIYQLCLKSPAKSWSNLALHKKGDWTFQIADVGCWNHNGQGSSPLFCAKPSDL